MTLATIKRIGLAILATSCILLLSTAQADFGRRILQGKVLAANGETIKGAVVQIENTQTLRIRSFLSEADGSYHFVGISPDIDYKVFAKYKGKVSPTKTVSQFDSSELVDLNLVIGR